MPLPEKWQCFIEESLPSKTISQNARRNAGRPIPSGAPADRSAHRDTFDNALVHRGITHARSQLISLLLTCKLDLP